MRGAEVSIARLSRLSSTRVAHEASCAKVLHRAAANSEGSITNLIQS